MTKTAKKLSRGSEPREIQGSADHQPDMNKSDMNKSDNIVNLNNNNEEDEGGQANSDQDEEENQKCDKDENAGNDNVNSPKKDSDGNMEIKNVQENPIVEDKPDAKPEVDT